MPFTDGFFGLAPKLEDSVRTSKTYHLLTLVTICYLSNHLDIGGG